MRVPLAANRLIQKNEQFVEIWTDQRRLITPAPFLPYYYMRDDPRQWVKPPPGVVRIYREDVQPLSALGSALWENHPTTQVWYKIEVKNVDYVKESHQFEASNPVVSGFAENHLGLMERILADQPEFFQRFPNTRPLRLMTFDIEQLSKGDGFPTEKDPLASIAWACDIEGQPDAEIECEINDSNDLDDTNLIKKFTNAIRDFNPDAFVGYNINGYDLNMLMKRMRELKLDIRRLSRSVSSYPYMDTQRTAKGAFPEAVIPGRIVYDVLQPVLLDQTMFGIKDRKLKTVAEWMKLPVIKENTGNLKEVLLNDPNRLRKYNKNDVFITRAIGRSYWANYIALAEEFGAPLNMLFRATPQFYVTALQAPLMQRARPRQISDGKSYDRFVHIYQHPNVPIKQGKKKPVTGAVVDIYKRGLFKPIWKIDFASLYPSIIIALGLGADTTRFIGWEPAGPFRCETREENGVTVRRYSFPDHGWNLNLIIEVHGFSEFSRKIQNILMRRLALKKMAKDEKDLNGETPMYLRLKAQENALKVTLNSVYGVEAGATARYGNLAVGITVTAVGRLLARAVEEYLGSAKVETDTDGVYCSADADEDQVNAILDRVAQEKFAIPNRMKLADGSVSQVLKVDVDAYDGAFFVEKKQYLLWKKGKLEKHGAAFKSSAACNVFDDTLAALAPLIFAEKKREAITVLQQHAALTKFKPQDFVMRIKIGEYDDDSNAVGAQIAADYYRVFNREPAPGDSVEYIKTTQGFEVATDDSMTRLDRPYYENIIVKLADTFNLALDGKQQATINLGDY